MIISICCSVSKNGPSPSILLGDGFFEKIQDAGCLLEVVCEIKATNAVAALYKGYTAPTNEAGHEIQMNECGRQFRLF